MGFKDRDADMKGKEMKSPWDFTQPKYDDRTSCYVNAGSHHGVGKRQPVGHEGNPKERVACLPFGRGPAVKVDEVPRKNLSVDMEK